MTDSADHPITTEDQGRQIAPPFKGDMLAKSITAGVAISTINHMGRSMISTLAKHPLLMFGFGLTAGYFVGKYRKEIISMAEQTADQGKSFILRQKENLLDLIAESQESEEEQDASK